MSIKEMKLYDMHMHCHFSGDSEASPFAMAQHACDIGLAGICFTDHLDIDYKETPGLFDLDIPSYKKEIALVKDEFKDRLDICWGIELGLQPYLAKRHAQIISDNPFDFVIASSHLCESEDPYYPDFFENPCLCLANYV